MEAPKVMVLWDAEISEIIVFEKVKVTESKPNEITYKVIKEVKSNPIEFEEKKREVLKEYSNARIL